MRDDPNRKLNDRYDRLRLIRTLVLLASHAHDSLYDPGSTGKDLLAPHLAVRQLSPDIRRLFEGSILECPNASTSDFAVEVLRAQAAHAGSVAHLLRVLDWHQDPDGALSASYAALLRLIGALRVGNRRATRTETGKPIGNATHLIASLLAAPLAPLAPCGEAATGPAFPCVSAGARCAPKEQTP